MPNNGFTYKKKCVLINVKVLFLIFNCFSCYIHMRKIEGYKITRCCQIEFSRFNVTLL